MKISRFLVASFLGLPLWTLPAQAATLWQIGLDNNANSSTEMDPEYQADDFFYLHAGNYSHLQGYTSLTQKSFGVDRIALGPEIVADGGNSTEGFERALTSGDPTTNVFFQLSAANLVAPQLKFSLDLMSPALYSANPPDGTRPTAFTDISVYFNDVLIGSQTDIATATLLEFTFNHADVNAVEGSNVISILRTGSSVPSGWTSSYISMDYLALASVPEPTRILLALGGIIALSARRKRA